MMGVVGWQPVLGSDVVIAMTDGSVLRGRIVTTGFSRSASLPYMIIEQEASGENMAVVWQNILTIRELK